jgi:septum formation protein
LDGNHSGRENSLMGFPAFPVLPPILLASASPRRRELLCLLGIPFGVCAPNIDERLPAAGVPALCAQRLAAQKAARAALEVPDACVIAADTVVAVGGCLLGKPKNRAEAERMLALLSGKTHRVATGVCLRQGPRERLFSQETKVRFYRLSPDEIQRYAATGEPLDKAGAYGIQGRGALLVESVNGSYHNVMGLPVAQLYRELQLFLA